MDHDELWLHTTHSRINNDYFKRSLRALKVILNGGKFSRKLMPTHRIQWLIWKIKPGASLVKSFHRCALRIASRERHLEAVRVISSSYKKLVVDLISNSENWSGISWNFELPRYSAVWQKIYETNEIFADEIFNFRLIFMLRSFQIIIWRWNQNSFDGRLVEFPNCLCNIFTLSMSGRPLSHYWTY